MILLSVVIDVKINFEGKRIKAYTYANAKALAASGSNDVFQNVNNYLFFGLGE